MFFLFLQRLRLTRSDDWLGAEQDRAMVWITPKVGNPVLDLRIVPGCSFGPGVDREDRIGVFRREIDTHRRGPGLNQSRAVLWGADDVQRTP